MFRCHFPIKPLFWGTFIQVTPSFKSHIVPPLPQKQVHIIFLSVTSTEWTPLFRGQLSWSLVCPLNGESTVLCLYQLPLLKGHLHLGDTWPGPEVIPQMEDPMYNVCISYLC